MGHGKTTVELGDASIIYGGWLDGGQIINGWIESGHMDNIDTFIDG